MSERATPDRTPDESPLGDANILDFVAQQQPVADLADFALQSTAGVTAGGAAIAPGSVLNTDAVLGADGFMPLYSQGAGIAISTVTTIADPSGTGVSILLTTTGGLGASWGDVADFGPVAIGGVPYIRITGSQMCTLGALGTIAHALFTVTWLDATNSPVAGIGNDEIQDIETESFSTGFWYPVSQYLQVPPGAVSVLLDVMVSADARDTFFYLNNFQATVPAVLEGVHSGFHRGRAAQEVPVGTIIMYGGSVGSPPPPGWLLCDGSAVAIEMYPELFQVINGNFNPAPGMNYFWLPDMRDRFPVGKSATKALGTYYSGSTHSHTLGAGFAAITFGTNFIDMNRGVDSWSSTHTITGTLAFVSSAHVETASAQLGGSTDAATAALPPYLAVNFLIKT